MEEYRMMNQYIEESEKVLMHTYNRFKIVLDHGEGVHLYDTDGKKYLDFAKNQIDYILGNNPNQMSYMVGFGDNYPKYPHHRAASGILEGPPADEKKELPERHILYGALVGGADKNDEYHDNVNEYVYSETGLDYNAGLVGALAGLSEYYGKDQLPEETPDIAGKPIEYY
jgi:hypothetical protein